MVEGPGCTLNGEKIRARVCPGQAVTEVRGSALQRLGDPWLPHAASVAAVSSQVSRSSNLLWDSKRKCSKDSVRFPGSKVLSLCPTPVSLEPCFSQLIVTGEKSVLVRLRSKELLRAKAARHAQACPGIDRGCFISCHLASRLYTQQKMVSVCL